MKKIVALALLLVLLLPVTNVFAHGNAGWESVPFGTVYSDKVTYKTTSYAAWYETAQSDIYPFGTMLSSNTLGNNIEFTVPAATDIQITYWQRTNYSGINDVYVDGVLHGSFNTHGTTSDYDMHYNITGLTDQPHVIKIQTKTFNGDNYIGLQGLEYKNNAVVYNPVTNLSETHDYQSVNLSWLNPADTTFAGAKILKDGIEVAALAKTTNSHSIGGLDADTTYTFGVIATYSDGSASSVKEISVKTDPLPPDTAPAGNITNLVVANTDTAVSLMYTLPVDSDFSHLKIYRDGVEIQDYYTATSFDDFGLNQNTTYVYKITSVDLAGNESAGLVQSVTTDITPDLTAPTAISGLIATPGNGSGSVTWDKHIESDVSGYNVYVDGVKHNSSLVMANNYIIGLLENGVDYSVTITAVDTAGNESVASAAAILTPSKALMPFFKPKYDLADVATGTASWFDSLWLLLAFSVSIPLAFIIARRIKGLFLA